jgi:asparagine synthase (glutamine-hydrolysing)
VREALVSEASQLRCICDGTFVGRLVDMHIEGQVNNDKILWSLINLELFLRMFKPADAEGMGTRLP